MAIRSLLDWLDSWSQTDIKAYHLCHAFIGSLEKELKDLYDPPTPPQTTRTEVSERPINLMLHIVQQFKGIDMSIKVHLIREGMSHFRQLRMIFDATKSWKELQDFLVSIQNSQESTILAQRLYPFLHQFNVFTTLYTENLLAWTKSLFKLSSILFNLAGTLAEKGFCKPSDGASSEGQEGKALDSEGAGIGEGVGEKDVSDEIQDKSQVEGLQGEETSSNTNTKEQDNAIDMSEDEMEGDLEDVKQSDDDENQDDQESEPEDEPEERHEALDPADPSAVDEKLWSGADRTEEKEEDKTTSKQADNDEQASDEIAGRKDDEIKAQKDEQHDKNPPSKDIPELQDTANTASDEEVEMPDTNDLPTEAGAELDDQAQEQEVLDLPDDLKLDEVDNKHSGDESDGDMEEDFGQGEENDGLDEEIDDHISETVNEADIGPPEANTEEEENNPEAPENPLTQADKTEGQGQQDSGMGSSGAVKSEEGQENSENAMDIDLEEIGKEQNLRYTLLLAMGEKTNPVSSATQDENQGSKATFSGEGDAGGENTTKVPVKSTSEIDPGSQQTSQKTLAEQYAEVRGRYEQILEQIEREQSQQNPATTSESQPVEHVDMDAEDTFAALGPAGQEEAAKLRDLNVNDDLAENLPSHDEDNYGHLEELLSAPPIERLSLSEREIQHAYDTEEKAIIPSDNLNRNKLVKEEEGSETAPLSLPKGTSEQITTEDVESHLVSWRQNRNPREGADSLWRLYSTLTHDLAWSLCEQLRLILEPTKATRLRGDYRTGKRLNMKKIIPYVASEYTKDKIWLRRTRPSQREYRIIIALDDSRSMSESHSEHLSFETIALVSRALTRLEVGDISILKFGETIDVLHGFDDGPFNDATGAKMINSFNFDQNSTNVLSLVDTSLRLFQDAKEKHGSASSSALWQLEIIISDGICSHHDKLRAVLRKALDAKVLVVFLIVDSLSRQGSQGRVNDTGEGGSRGVHNSILSMQTVRDDLTIQRYLDTFPFEYHVVLRSVDALPEVLAGTLKQFFERVAEE
jgi:midasin